MTTPQDFREVFLYEPETGRLLWRVSKAGPGAKAGREAGSVKSDGRYRTVFTFGHRWYVHRVAWEMTFGPIPPELCIDHINGNGLDNRLINLRVVTRSLNQRNRRRSKVNRTGVTGVHHHGNAFVAECAGEYLGRFRTVAEAAVARNAAALRKNYLLRKD